MKKTIASLMLTALGLSCAIGQSVTVNLQATNIWVDTMVYVTNGESVTINANGNWCYQGLVNGIRDTIFGFGNVPDGFNDGPGDSDIFLGNDIHSSVIAYVGSDPFVSTMGGFPQTSGYWEVGSSGQFISNTNGYLWVGMQDDANSLHYSDNDGSVNAQIFLGYGSTNSDWPSTRPVVSVDFVSSNSFAFNISDTNYPNSFWAVYDTSDLKNWVLVGAVTLDDNGIGAFTNTTGVPYRFYKISNGQTTSRIVGFDRISIPAYSTNLIANQLDSGNNTLDGLFNQTVVINGTTYNNAMPDGTSLPSGTVMMFWNGGGYNSYPWTGSSWSSGGSTVLEPGNGAFIQNNTASPFTITFAGLVEEGQLTVSIPGGNWSIISSKVPQAGGIQSVLDFTPGAFDFFLTGTSYSSLSPGYFYDPTVSPPWDDGSGNPISYEPVIQVGQPFFISPNGGPENWVRDFSAYP